MNQLNNNYYWNDQIDLMIMVYLTGCTSTKNNIYNTYLHQPFFKMAEIILNRYFKGFLDMLNNEFISITDVVHDAITHLLMKLNKFNYRLAKSYSFCQTVIKNFYYEYFKKITNKNKMYSRVDDIDINIITNIPATNYNINEIGEYKEDIIQALNRTNKEQNKQTSLAISTLIAFIIKTNSINFNIYYLSLYLQRTTGLDSKVINRIFKQSGIGIVTISLHKIERKFNLIPSTDAGADIGELIAIQLMAMQDDEKKYKITDKSKIKRKNWMNNIK
jgi:hypothetical protein